MSTHSANTVKVWDPLIRVFHWSLVFFFFLAYITEDDWMTIHSYAGYCIALLVLFRLIWGVIGTAHARFSDFIVAPADVIVYGKQLLHGKAKRYLGHNPAGAAMIVTLLASVTITVVSGVFLYATEGYGPLANTFLSSWSEDFLEEVHESFANFTLLMVAAHAGGVLLSSFLHRENLVRAMVSGRKRKNSHLDEDVSDDHIGEHIGRQS